MPRGVTAHSDRGSQYCSAVYQKLFREHRLVCGMGKKGDCYDNAAMESWNHSFKVEAVHGARFLTRSEAKRQVFEYIEVHYNRTIVSLFCDSLFWACPKKRGRLSQPNQAAKTTRQALASGGFGRPVPVSSATQQGV